jgi:hypothetical protein
LHPHPRRRRRLRNALIIVGIVAVVCCAGGITAGVLAVRAGDLANSAVRDAGDAFINDLQANNYSEAYGRMCASLHDQFTLDQFTQQVQSRPHIRSHRVTSTSVANVNGRTTGLVDADLARDGGTSDSSSFTLTKEGGVWKVCSQPPY